MRALLVDRAATTAAGPGPASSRGLALALRGRSASAAVHRRRLPCVAVYQTDTGMPRPPPPPPPPPPTPEVSRRGFLQQFGGLGAAAAVGGVIGFFAGSRSGGSEGNGGLSAAERSEVDELRRELHFRRDYDGHVFVRDAAGDWWEVRLDSRLPGTMLLRDKDNYVHFLTYQNVQQIDLSDDYVVGSLFTGDDWKALIQRVQARNDSGDVVDVRLDKDSFRNLISVMD